MKQSMPWSLAGKLTFWYMILGVGLIGGITFFLYWGLTKNLLKEDDRFLADQVHVLRILLKTDPENKAAFRQEVEWEASARHFEKVYLRVLENDKRVFIETPGMSELLPAEIFPAPNASEIELPEGFQQHSKGKPFRVMSALGFVGNSTDTKLLQVALDREHETEILSRYRRQLMTASIIALVICGFVGHQIARSGTRPIREIAETARRIRSTTLHERIQSERFSRELVDLSATFNEMFDRLQDSFTRLSRFSADLAHELRTPINNLRGEIEVALTKPRTPEEYNMILESALDECGRLARIIESLLFLARAENSESMLQPEKVDLAHEIFTVRDFYDAAAREAGITLNVTKVSGEAVVDRTLLQRALGNLIENSLKFTPQGGKITLSCEAADTAIHVKITDTGCGIPQKDLTNVFDRFFKGDPARTSSKNGAGLGLAIVKSIVELHRGSIHILSEIDKGTEILLIFPQHHLA